MAKTLFTNIPSYVGNLLRDVQNGRIGLPDLQRPFVWKDAKVRELLDSMYRGFPIGYIMLWDSPVDYDRQKQIGDNQKIYQIPDDLVIDGQQRLTALLAALYGIKIKDKDYKERKIKISFNPLKSEFQVWTQAFERDPEYINSVSDIFEANEQHKISSLRKQYIKAVNEARIKNEKEQLSDDEEVTIEENINAVLDLSGYMLPTLKISADANEEDVAEIFVRVNSGGQKLTEKNFIETLLAVFDNTVHDEINAFCEESRIPANGTAYNQILAVEPSHLIRVAVGVGFHRARLHYAYMLMRGKDLKTGETSKAIRDANLQKFKDALYLATNLNNWHAFLNIFAEAGYLTKDYVASTNAVVFSYVLYLIGKFEYKVPSHELRHIIRKWIFMTTVTYFYTGSTESEVEKQMADLRNVKTADEFIKYLDSVIASKFTDDYFNITLPQAMITSSGQSPVWYGYIAAVNVLGTPMLFSTTPLSKHLVLGSNGTKNSIDKHHIFPKAYLASIGIDDDRMRNQMANYTYLDYQTNIEISDDAPSLYVTKYKEKLGEEGYKKACAENALPENFENMDYQEFLEARRKLMAQIIKRAYEELCK